MCILFISLRQSVYCAFNRDQNSHRPTLPARIYQNLLFSKDQISGGSWYAFNTVSRVLVLLTNLDQIISQIDPDVHYHSRGKLVISLAGQQSFEKAQTYIRTVLKEKQFFNFNILVVDLAERRAFYTNNVDKEIVYLEWNKEYSMSNDVLSKPYQKCKYGLALFKQTVKSEPSHQQFQKVGRELMKNTKAFSKIPQEQSSIFIQRYFNRNLQVHWQTKSSFFISLLKGQLKFTQVIYDHQEFKQTLNIVHIN